MNKADLEVLFEGYLTTSQSEAALDDATEILALACAGSGKSRTLGFRIAALVAQGADPSGIVAFTFTVKSAESLKLRVSRALELTGQSPLLLGRMFIGTIDAFTKAQLGSIDARYRQFEQLDPPRMVLYLISRYPALGIARLTPGLRYFKAIESVASAWETMQNEGLEIADIEDRDPIVGDILTRLSTQLDQDEYVDFASTTRKTAEAYADPEIIATGRLLQVSHLLVDEYQDVNPLQQRLIDAIHGSGSNLFAVGDDDQAIYGFRGADVSNILSFQNRYPRANTHELTENFRSTRAIVDAASDFVRAELGANRIPKHPVSRADVSPQDLAVLEFDDRASEAAWVARRINDLIGTEYVESNGTTRGLTPGDFAVLMKSTRRSDWGDAPEANHRPYTNALAELRIESVVESTGDLFDRPYASLMRDIFELFRNGSPDRATARTFFDGRITDLFPRANVTAFFNTLTTWGRKIFVPVGAPRQRLYPQQLLQELLSAFNFAESDLGAQANHDLGTFSKILQDVESVFPTIDGQSRWSSILNFLGNAADGEYEAGSDEILARPDVVFVSTIHKAKGLEFPVVFIVDCRSSQYPGKSSGYNGLLPAVLMAGATARGAYVSRPDNAARVFYTALTRAERYLYISMARDVGKQRAATLSRYAAHIRASGAKTLLADVTPAGRKVELRRRLDDDMLPTTFTDIRYYLRCPYDYKLRKIYGFSPPINEMFGFGQTVHTSIGKIHEANPGARPTVDDAAEIVRDTFKLKHVMPSREPDIRPGAYERAKEAAVRIASNYVDDHGDDFTEQRKVEARFEIPLSGAVITGAIDLLIRRDAEGAVIEADVIDFKAIQGAYPPGTDPLDNERLDWGELALQVQLYAMAANEVLGENARTGSVHLLKDNLRVAVPIDDLAIAAAVANVEWAVARIVASDFPMRPSVSQEKGSKCGDCDFALLCPKRQQQFETTLVPPEIYLPEGRTSAVAAFRED